MLTKTRNFGYLIVVLVTATANTVPVEHAEGVTAETCVVPVTARNNCSGSGGLIECEEVGCCYDEKDSQCFHPLEFDECVVPESLKEDCGDFDEIECREVACCYDERAPANGTFCYRPTNVPLSTTTPKQYDMPERSSGNVFNIVLTTHVFVAVYAVAHSFLA